MLLHNDDSAAVLALHTSSNLVRWHDELETEVGVTTIVNQLSKETKQSRLQMLRRWTADHRATVRDMNQQHQVKRIDQATLRKFGSM